MKFKTQDREYYIDGTLARNLDIGKTLVKQNWDFVTLLTGIEGGGKSSLGESICSYLDPKFDLSKIVFNPNSFMEAVEKLPRKSAILYDEAYSGLSSRGTLTEVNRALIQKFSEIRSKNLYIEICMPNFWEMDKYIAMWRSRFLISIYNKGMRRGFFKFFSYKRKISLYITGKKFYFSRTYPNFRGRFTKAHIVDTPEYEYKKQTERLMGMDKKTDKFRQQRDSLLLYLKKNDYSEKKVREVLNEATGEKYTLGSVKSMLKKARKENVR